KRMLFSSMVAVSIILLFYLQVQTGEQLFMVRLLHGLAGGILIPAAFAYIGDLSSDKSRGKSMAFTGASIRIAAIVGRAFGGVMAVRASIQSVFLFIAGLFLLTALLILKFVNESFAASERYTVGFSHFLSLLK